MKTLLRRSAVLLVVALCAVAIVTATPGTTETEASPAALTAVTPASLSWNAVAASGPVEAHRVLSPEDQWDRVRRGDRIEPMSAVRTGRKGRATLTRNSDVLLLDPNSQIELPYSEAPDPEAPVIQTHGSVLYEIDGSAERSFQVVTPYLVAGVKGTVFMVTVTKNYASVTVEEGLVEVSDRFSGDHVAVGAGQTVLVDAEQDAAMEIVRRDEPRRKRKDARISDEAREHRKAARDEFRRMARAIDFREDNWSLDDELDRVDAEIASAAPDPGQPAEIAETNDRESILTEAISEEQDDTITGILDDDSRSGPKQPGEVVQQPNQ